MSDTVKVQSYKEDVKKQAEVLVLKGFPDTIVKLNDILDTSQFKNRRASDVRQDLNIAIPEPVVLNSHSDLPPAKKAKRENSISQDGAKVMILPSGSVSSNKYIIDLVEQVKPHIKKLLEDSNLIKMWISLMIPKIEDGNNFGVSIQEDTLAEVQTVESDCASYFDQISRYFISRGKLISKLAKYPYIDDYRRAINELDEKEYISIWLVMSEIRNKYCSLHDIVLKNIDKIKKPRPANATESLY